MHNKKTVHSLFESLAKNNSAKYIDGTKAMQQTATLYYKAWFDQDATTLTLPLERG